MMLLRSTVLSTLLLAGTAAELHAAGDSEMGNAIARRWCTSCHVVGPGAGGSDVAPAFAEIARDPTKTPDHLRTWLADPHFSMPNPQLTRSEIDDLVAYIESLRPR
jgi:mono/diheme cytochrome c family protein